MTSTVVSFICPTCGALKAIDIEKLDFRRVLACGDCGCLFFLVIPPTNVTEEDIMVARLVKEGSLLKRKGSS
jgi:transcription elongation factor Elf1